MSATLAAKSIKVTLVVDPAGGRSLRATFNAKSLRRAQAAVRKAGPEAIAVIVQGKLGPGDEVHEAGIAATLKTAKPAEAAA